MLKEPQRSKFKDDSSNNYNSLFYYTSQVQSCVCQVPASVTSQQTL